MRAVRWLRSSLRNIRTQVWGLSIYNTLDGSTAEIECEVENIPSIVSFVYNLEHAYPMTFIGENPATESYVVGMRCTRGRIEMPAAYKDVDGELQKQFAC